MDALEDAVTRRCLELMEIPYDTLAILLNADGGYIAHRARILRREASIIARPPLWSLLDDDEDDDDAFRILVVGIVPMRWWPLGSWLVLDGFEAREGKSSERLSFELLDKYW